MHPLVIFCDIRNIYTKKDIFEAPKSIVLINYIDGLVEVKMEKYTAESLDAMDKMSMIKQIHGLEKK